VSECLSAHLTQAARLEGRIAEALRDLYGFLQQLNRRRDPAKPKVCARGVAAARKRMLLSIDYLLLLLVTYCGLPAARKPMRRAS